MVLCYDSDGKRGEISRFLHISCMYVGIGTYVAEHGLHTRHVELTSLGIVNCSSHHDEDEDIQPSSAEWFRSKLRCNAMHNFMLGSSTMLLLSATLPPIDIE